MRGLILLLTACARTDPGVTTTAFDGGFGPLASAVWLRTVYEASWALGSGALDLASVTTLAIRGSFEGELLSEGGEISATFEARRWEIAAD